MNLAFQAVVFLLLYLPGALFLFSYYGKLSGNKELPVSTPSVTARTVLALVLASAFHAVWVALANLAAGPFGLHVDLGSVLFFLVGRYDQPSAYDKAIASITNWPYCVFLYFVSLYAVATILGFLSHRLVRANGWDRRYRWLRFSDHWHYLFSGEVSQFSEYAPETFGVDSAVDTESGTDSMDGALIAATIELGGKAYLYVGILEGYWYDDKGVLDAIWLSYVFRRELAKDHDQSAGSERLDLSEDSRYYAIDGDFFVVKFADLKNINIKYISVEPTTLKEHGDEMLDPV